MGTTDKVAGKRGCGFPDIGTYILGGGPVGFLVQIGAMVADPTHQEGVGQIPPQGSLQADGEATSAREVWCVYIHPDRGNDGRDGTVEDGDLCLLPLEQSCTVHYDQDHYGPVYGGGLETRSIGIQAVVRTRQGGRGGDVDGILGGGMDGGGR